MIVTTDPLAGGPWLSPPQGTHKGCPYTDPKPQPWIYLRRRALALHRGDWFRAASLAARDRFAEAGEEGCSRERGKRVMDACSSLGYPTTSKSVAGKGRERLSAEAARFLAD